ncbi:MAG: methionyl-tRNA formyltransferase [Candidatus Eremiobacteraeota bacterium]|nr:methionyl-tRNA formyltransferase [Candidatus Eremiobacteraeota bacterium]
MAARRLRVLFFGSSAFSLPSLAKLRHDHNVVAVVTQPPKPAGRGLKLVPTVVERAAQDAGIPALTPARLDARLVEQVAGLHVELLASASYGKIVPDALLALPALASLNVHPSLLPSYRGATPIQSALRDGCAVTGVTVFWMTARMDAGDIALARSVGIAPADNYGTVHDRLAAIGGELLGESAALLSNAQLPRAPQREEDATYCRPLTKEDLRLAFDASADSVVNQVRSLSPKPGAWMQYEGKRLKVLQAEVAADQGLAQRTRGADALAPGALVTVDAQGPVIACRGGAVRLLRVIPEGKAVMSGAQFVQRA